MRKLNLDFLLDTRVERLVENIDFFLIDFLQEIESDLQLEPIDYRIDTSIKG